MSRNRVAVAISVGDLNGIGLEIALKAHKSIIKMCDPIYCINETMLHKSAKLLGISIPKDFTLEKIEGDFTIEPGKISAKSGKYAFNSFLKAVELAKCGSVDAITTLPIHKKAWEEAGVVYKGHTDALRDIFKTEAIMMLGCEAMYVALYSEHIPLKEVAASISTASLVRFFLDFYKSIHPDKVAVLGLNPHAGDNGVLGDEEEIIEAAIQKANKQIGFTCFIGPQVPDIAFTPANRKRFKYFIAMYHDQGLAPLKALYFDESINVSLNLPIIRTSVDHGTAFDIAYKNQADTKSYKNAIETAVRLSSNK